MRQHRRIEQGLIARDGGGEAVRQRETRVSFQMRKEIAMRETLSRAKNCETTGHDDTGKLVRNCETLQVGGRFERRQR